jgi:signal transduction histidine kinase
MLPRSNHRLVFASAIFLLLVCGSTLGWMLHRIYSGEEWVRHSYNVQLLIAEIGSDINRSGRARESYLDTGEKQYLKDLGETRGQLQGNLAKLKAMVRDSADEERASENLEQAIKGRMATSDESLHILQSGKSSQAIQDLYTQELARWAQQASAILGTMQEAESNLLRRRLLLTKSLFTWIIVILALTYIVSIYMLWDDYRVLGDELEQRIRAERNAHNLSAQLLNAQDQERRKIARELHDGLGQNLAAAKMIADSLLKRPSDRQKMMDLSAILHDAVSSTRSISYLLHPPLVDELGFVSAARSYLEGFSNRSGVKVTCELPENGERLPRDLELTLFRVLQEALTNIQRHSKSPTAEVQFKADGRFASLKIQDHGIGLPPTMGNNSNENGTGVGVGLAGMKERVRERNGNIEIRSDSTGTCISATFPVVPDRSLPS